MLVVYVAVQGIMLFHACPHDHTCEPPHHALCQAPQLAGVWLHHHAASGNLTICHHDHLRAQARVRQGWTFVLDASPGVEQRIVNRFSCT
jgi:hypothetical protein